MKKYVSYIAATLVGLASLLPSCNSSGNSDKRKQAQQVVDLQNIRTSIEELLNNAGPKNPIELILSDAVITDQTTQFTEGQAARDIGYRLQHELQLRHNTYAVMVTPRFVSGVESSPYEKNRILVGTPANNVIIKNAISSLPDPQDRILPPVGTGRVYAIKVPNGNFVIVVTGKDSFDVMDTGYVLSEYDRYRNSVFMDFNAQIVDINSSTLLPDKIK